MGNTKLIKEEKRENVCRLHISYCDTIFYRVVKNIVYITELMISNRRITKHKNTIFPDFSAF